MAFSQNNTARMMGPGFYEAVASSESTSKPSKKSLLGKKSSKAALKTETPALNMLNGPSHLSQAQIVDTSNNNSRTTTEPSGRVTFAPIPYKDGEQNQSTAIQPGSIRTSGENDRVSKGPKESASHSNLRQKFKGLFSKKSSKSLHADSRNIARTMALDDYQDPAHHVMQLPLVDDPIMDPYNGRVLSRLNIHGPDKSNTDHRTVQIQTRDQVQGAGEARNFKSMIFAMRRMSMHNKRDHRPRSLKLAPRGAIPVAIEVGDLKTPFWEDPRPPRPLHAGKSFENPKTPSTWALRPKLSYRINTKSGRAEPTWKVAVDLKLVEAVAVRQLQASGFPRIKDYRFEASLCSEDAWTRRFAINGVNCKTGKIYECHLSLCLPQFPGYKLLSLVATMVYVAMKTTLPVPLVIYYDKTTKNPFSMEYIMTKNPEGKPYAIIEHELGLDAKKTFARNVADCVDQLSKLAFSDIGSLYHDDRRSFEDSNAYYVGTMTEPHTTRDMRIDYKLNRGPYSTLREYYNAQVEVVRLEAKDPRQQDRLEHCFPPPNRPHPDDDIEEDNAKHYLLLKRLGLPEKMPLPKEDGLWEFLPAPLYTYDDLKLLPTICEALQEILPLLVSSKEPVPGATRVSHFNLSKSNILVNNSGEITGIVGWESAWVAPPELLQKYPPCIPNLSEESPDTCSDFELDGGNGEREDQWEELTMAMEFEDRLRELGSAHLEVLAHERSSKVVQMERFLRKPPSMETFMEFLDSVGKAEDVKQRDSMMASDANTLL